MADKQVDQAFGNTDRLKAVVNQIFPTITPIRIERVTEGVSTYVYRIILPHETFYLRVLPEEDASFAPEVTVHSILRQMHIKVPEVIYFEPYNALLQRSIMVTSEIKGLPICQSPNLSRQEMMEILRMAGQDLARINSVPVAGFGWIERGQLENSILRAQWPTRRAFEFAFWDADLAYLTSHSVLTTSEATQLEAIITHHASWLETDQAYLAHGDFDTTQIYQQDGQYTGIIDFGEIRGTDCWYDLGYFHMRDGDLLSKKLEADLLHGYLEMAALPTDYVQRVCFASVLINIRALALSLQKRLPDRHTDYQLKGLRQDITVLTKS